MDHDPELSAELALLRRIGGALTDAYVVVDAERRVVDFNRHYFSLFPRHQARKLKGGHCCQFLKLGICENGECLARRCMRENQAVRYDEIPAFRVDDEGHEAARFIVSGAPLGSSAPLGALLMLRDVSDAADVQRKYKEILETEAKEKERLKEEIFRKTKELMDTNLELNRVQKELMGFKKGLFG